MKIWVRVSANAREEKIVPGGEYWRVAVRSPAKEGRANARAIEMLADHFGVAIARVRLASGHKSKLKSFEIS